MNNGQIHGFSMSGEKSPCGSSINTVLQLTNKFCGFLPNRAAHTFPACQGLYVAGIILPPCVLVSTSCIASLSDPHSASLLPPVTFHIPPSGSTHCPFQSTHYYREHSHMGRVTGMQ